MSSVTDTLGRPLRDIRISVTDQCNFRCSYCMPAEIFGPDYAFLPPEDYLTFAEIERVVKAAASLGVEKVRITGGEPLLRKDLPTLVNKLTRIEGIKDVALTTNAVFLPKHARALKEAGLKRVNVSLDAIDDEVFKKMNGRNVGIKPVLKGIEAAKEAGLDVKINMVVQKHVNDHQVIPMAAFFKGKNVTLRFIEFMDVGSTNGWKLDSVITKKEIISLLQSHFGVRSLEPSYYGEVASRYAFTDSSGEIGVISSVSQSFCSSCTRARVSVEGKLFTCLFATKGHDLRAIMRGDTNQEHSMEDELRRIWKKRSDRYSDERTEESSANRPKIEMSYIGG
ncbi:GTP 3',8-cyclase MoaA [Alkalicoccobacillus murimartini]|uniref:GTP 3',8-cyclase n=1 Tax=Alkalicoccobacillus murimartini TaxID=171685 RepID=A0ABT9YNW7_9BACI|nr:GTP 3',8-cyclase MoaA [Alkalicoccobacillus murimartini]MDQ0208902.1 cyclic pyranopterin phosphate synthase [Alkalicoccobacillus murimartini]